MATDMTKYIQNEEQRPLLSMLSTADTVRKFELACGRKAGEVIINIINAAALAPLIYKCTPDTVVTAALNAATLKLSLAPNLGQACILPFKKNTKNGSEWTSEYRAQLIVMVRGVKELAMRTNKYRVLNDFKLYEGQAIEEDQMSGRKTIVGKRISDKVIGYGAYMLLTNGYEHTVYWEVEKVMAHAKRYSPTFDQRTKQFNDKSRWVTDFDASASKTVVKDLIMNHGVISEDDRAQLAAIDDERGDGDIIQGESEYIDEPKAEETESEYEAAKRVLSPNGNNLGGLNDSQIEQIVNSVSAKVSPEMRNAARIILDNRIAAAQREARILEELS